MNDYEGNFRGISIAVNEQAWLICSDNDKNVHAYYTMLNSNPNPHMYSYRINVYFITNDNFCYYRKTYTDVFSKQLTDVGFETYINYVITNNWI